MTTFSETLTELKAGKIMKRAHWGSGNAQHILLDESKQSFKMHMTGGADIPWTPTTADIFAEDWEVA